MRYGVLQSEFRWRFCPDSAIKFLITGTGDCKKFRNEYAFRNIKANQDALADRNMDAVGAVKA